VEGTVKKALLAAFVGAGMLGVGPVSVSAHHSSAMYDGGKEVELAGTVKEFQYTNPHAWLIVAVVGKDGKTVDWGFEMEGPSSLLRAGIKISSLKPGEMVVVKGHPLRDGRPAAGLVSVAKADGSVLSRDAALRRGPGGKQVVATATP
jgi:hypothetical protein